MARTIRVALLVTFDLPPGATKGMAKEYVDSWVRSGCGGLDPQEAMFDLDRDSVRVTYAGANRSGKEAVNG